MAGYLICICFESGVPIFARKIGDVAPIPFPLAASINGVKVFGRANGVELISTLTESSRIVWKDFHDRLSLIFAGTDDSVIDFHVEHLLVNVFSALVMRVGLDEILKTKNVDKLKKEFRVCYPLIDLILEGIKPSDKTLYFGDITGCADVALQMDPPHHSINFQSILENLMESMGVKYGCIVGNGKTLLACTKDWWTLSGIEICLLTLNASLIIVEDKPVTDTPVFLPSSSPNLLYRFIIFKILDNVHLCIICGQEPSGLPAMEKEIGKSIRKNFAEQLPLFQNKIVPWSKYARYFAIDKAISGFLLVCLDRRRCAFSVFPKEKENEQMSTAYKLDLLRTFYKNTVGSVFPWSCAPSSQVMFTSPNLHAHPAVRKVMGPIIHKGTESYWSNGVITCHAMASGFFQLFVIYEPEVQMGHMRQVTRNLIQELVKEKVFR